MAHLCGEPVQPMLHTQELYELQKLKRLVNRYVSLMIRLPRGVGHKIARHLLPSLTVSITAGCPLK